MLEDSAFNTVEKQDQQIVVSKSVYNRLIITIISIAIISAFLGGYVIGGETVEPKEIIIRETVQISQTRPATQEQFGPQIILNISLDDDPMKGNPDAPITIVEFSDFQCPFCAKFHETTLPQIEQNYISTGKVNFVYRDFPIQSIHPNAIPAALASECADDQRKFWEMHDMIFEKGFAGGAATYKGYAKDIGLNTADFNDCLDSGEKASEVAKDMADGQAAGVRGTPGFIINGQLVSGAQPFSAFQQVIDAALRG